MTPLQIAQLQAHLANKLRGERTRQAVRGAVNARRAARQGTEIGWGMSDILSTSQAVLDPLGALGVTSPTAAAVQAAPAILNPAGALGQAAANVIAPPPPTTPGYVPYDPGAPAYAEPAVASASITGTGVNIRSQPSENSATLGQLPANAVVEVLNTNGGPPTPAAPAGWMRIRFGGVSGYVSKSYISGGGPPPPPPPAVASYTPASSYQAPTSQPAYVPVDAPAYDTSSSLMSKIKPFAGWFLGGCAVVLVGGLGTLGYLAHKKI